MLESRGFRSLTALQPRQGLSTKVTKIGLVRDLNPGPLAPEARIIPLDQRALDCIAGFARPSKERCSMRSKLTVSVNARCWVFHGLYAVMQYV